MKLTLSVGLALLILVASACSDKSSKTVFSKTDGYSGFVTDPNNSTIVTGDGTYVGPSSVAAGGEECLDLEGVGQCIDPTAAKGKFCNEDGAKADVIVVDGEIVEVICYPPPKTENTTVVVETSGNIDVPQNANNTVIVFDSDTDSKEIDGNISLDGNNVAIYGNGPDKTIINGDLEIGGNNTRIRGVRIKGNVTFTKNNGALLFSVVEGNLHIPSNNNTVASVVVWGNVQVDGNNNSLVQMRVAGNWQLKNKEQICDGNLSFSDADQDGVVDSDELGTTELSCK